MFFDFEKAFDRVDRNLLVQKLLSFKYKGPLVRAITHALSNTSITYDGAKITTNIGCPQGSILSPELWKIYSADLAR